MMQYYDTAPNNTDPFVYLRLPRSILEDLKIRAADNGFTLEIEAAIRLARTLEHDFDMIEKDNQLLYAAFQRVHENDTEL